MSKEKRELKLRGDMEVCTEWMRTKQIYTKQELINYMVSELGMTEQHATYKAIILLTPRETSKHGDCRGSSSNRWGHIAYNEKLPRKIENGKKESQRYRFRFREVELDPKLYPYQERKLKSEQEKEPAVAIEDTVPEVAGSEVV